MFKEFSHCQQKDGTIYLFGGDFQVYSQKWQTSRFCYKIDPDLHVDSISSMKKPRSLMASKILRDRFAFVIGGRQISNSNQYTTDCECYDIERNSWFKIQKLPWAQIGCLYVCLLICDDNTLLAVPAQESKVFQCYMLDFSAVFREKD